MRSAIAGVDDDARWRDGAKVVLHSVWIDRVDSIIVELHERLKDGCRRAFQTATNGLGEQ